MIETIPIEKLHPSSRNRDPGDVTELAESIEQHGILQPLMVAPVNGGYEVVFGARRLAAAKLVGLDAPPGDRRRSAERCRAA